jgi:hypothetical protein
MKTLSFSLLAAALATGLASATTAYTTPVGYETITLNPGVYNLAGVRLFNPAVAAGIFDSSTTTSLTDNQASFALTANKEYVIEIDNGGVIISIGSNFSGTTISNLTGITPAFQTNYIIREVSTIASVFGAANQSGIASSANADPTEADIVLIPKTGGGFTRVFYSTYVDPVNDPNGDFNGWLDADDFSKAAGEALVPGVGLFVQTANSASPIQLTVTGEVKLTPTAYIADQGYSLMSSVYPASSTLSNSSLSTYVQGSANADPTEADVILLPKVGGFTRAFFSTYVDPVNDPNGDFNGWLDADDFSKIPGQALTPGFFIQKIGPNINGVLTPPTSYNNL